MIKKLMACAMMACAVGLTACDDDDDDTGSILDILKEGLLDDAAGTYTTKVEAYTTSDVKGKTVMIPDVASLLGSTFKDMPNATVTKGDKTLTITGGGTTFGKIELTNGAWGKTGWQYQSNEFLCCEYSMKPCYNWTGETASDADGSADKNASFLSIANYSTITVYMEAPMNFTFDDLKNYTDADLDTESKATTKDEMTELLKKMLVKKLKKKLNLEKWEGIAEDKKAEVTEKINAEKQLFKLTFTKTTKNDLKTE